MLDQVYAARGSRVLDALRASSLPAPYGQVRVARAALGGDSPLIGAAELAFDALLCDPLGDPRCDLLGDPLGHWTTEDQDGPPRSLSR